MDEVYLSKPRRTLDITNKQAWFIRAMCQAYKRKYKGKPQAELDMAKIGLAESVIQSINRAGIYQTDQDGKKYTLEERQGK